MGGAVVGVAVAAGQLAIAGARRRHRVTAG
jgi:hypothetical protein